MCLLHHIFQKTGITPDEFYEKPKGVQAFMLASMRITLESQKGGMTVAETLRIEIPIETVDNTDPGVSNATKKFEKMERAANSANSSAKKASDTVSKFDKQAQKTEKSLASWAKEKYEVLLEAKERISPVLSTLGNGLRSFAGKTWSVTMRAIDLITSPVRGIINLLKNPIFQVGAVLGVSIGLKDTIETYKDFEAAMSQVQAISRSHQHRACQTDE